MRVWSCLSKQQTAICIIASLYFTLYFHHYQSQIRSLVFTSRCFVFSFLWNASNLESFQHLLKRHLIIVKLFLIFHCKTNLSMYLDYGFNTIQFRSPWCKYTSHNNERRFFLYNGVKTTKYFNGNFEPGTLIALIE